MLSLPVRTTVLVKETPRVLTVSLIIVSSRIHTLLRLSSYWKNYDVFARQKTESFQSSRSAVLELVLRYRGLISDIQNQKAVADKTDDDGESTRRLLFYEMCDICLWGNASDLSLLATLEKRDISELQGSEARKAAEKNTLVNDLPAAYEVLRKAQESGKAERRIDIVLDNSGFELFVDLVLAGYLLESGLATQIILHPKSIPWFVSDVTPTDFASILGTLADPRSFFSIDDNDTDSTHTDQENPKTTSFSDQNLSDFAFLFDHWTHLYQEGQLILRPNIFWTSSQSYWSLPTLAPDLFHDLQESELVIFKGDLNYRKLTADAAWSPTTSFATAIGPMGLIGTARAGSGGGGESAETSVGVEDAAKGRSGVRVLALRTCKADTVVGLKEGEDERLRAEQAGSVDARRWAWSGKWAVVQFCDGKI